MTKPGYYTISLKEKCKMWYDAFRLQPISNHTRKIDPQSYYCRLFSWTKLNVTRQKLFEYENSFAIGDIRQPVLSEVSKCCEITNPNADMRKLQFLSENMLLYNSEPTDFCMWQQNAQILPHFLYLRKHAARDIFLFYYCHEYISWCDFYIKVALKKAVF